MKRDASDLVVRRHERVECSVPAVLAVDAAQRGEVVLVAGVTNRDGWLDVEVVDVSEGGMGFVTSVYVPTNAQVRVRVGAEGVFGVLEEGFEAVLRVRRAEMVSSEPRYYLGCKFSVGDERSGRVLRSVIEGARTAAADASGPTNEGRGNA